MPATGHSTKPSRASNRSLGTKIPERKIDLSLDYEVNNELAFALYARAMQEPFRLRSGSST